MLWSLVASVSERGDAAAALEVAKRAALTAPNQKSLREEVVSHYRKACPGAVRLEEMLNESKLLESDDLEAALELIEYYLRLQPGAYVAHRLSARVGRVKAVEGRVYVVEADGSEYRHAPEEAMKYWRPLKASDFRAMVALE